VCALVSVSASVPVPVSVPVLVSVDFSARLCSPRLLSGGIGVWNRSDSLPLLADLSRRGDSFRSLAADCSRSLEEPS
jgi:hypothetical protein